MDLMGSYDMLRDMPVVHDDGTFISAKVSRIVELIREYDPNLEVRWIPEKARERGDAAFVISEMQPNGLSYPVVYIQNDEDMNESVLARLYRADGTNGNDPVAAADAWERARKEVDRKAWEDSMEQRADLARSMLRSGKHEYRHNGRKIQL